MTFRPGTKNNITCAIVESDSVVITDIQSALDLLMTAKYEVGTKNIVIDKKLITEDFFVLSSGIAGEILQKYVNYGGRIAIYGDYSHYTSKPLGDFIYESNKGKNVVFVDTKEAAIDMLTENKIKYFENREDWRNWLMENFDTANEIWFVFPGKSSGEKSILYNDAVEEALCFEWIDSTIRPLDKDHKIQRFTPRNPKSTYSQANKERLKWLLENDRIHPRFKAKIQTVLSEPFIFPSDIIDKLKEDKIVWKNYQQFSDSYQRIRIAYIEAARTRPEEFEKRLNHFIKKTKENKTITGYGGIGKYY